MDNFGDVLLATDLPMEKLIPGIRVLQQDSRPVHQRPQLDYVTTSAPTASRAMMMAPVTRHLVLFGTETTIGTASTQDDMFIRFSDQETINTFATHRNQQCG